MKVEIYPDRKAAGVAAAKAAAEALIHLGHAHESIAAIFATGASQLDTLDALTGIKNLPWNRVTGFHMDEYVGIGANHPASFRRYLRERLTRKVHMREFFEIDGDASNSERLRGTMPRSSVRPTPSYVCLASERTVTSRSTILP